MLTFLTLGPQGSNHDLVLRRYVHAHGLMDRARIALIDDFHEGARAVIAKQADFMLQCAVHPATPDVTGSYRKELAVVDAFISPSQPMALVRRVSPSANTGKVGIQPATARYADLSRWPVKVREPTVLAVLDGLLEGRYEAGIVFASALDLYPHILQLAEPIGTVCDAWVVFGREAVDGGTAVVWTQSPVSQQYHARN